MSAELPDLKKKEKERKKAGAFWGNGAAGRAAFQGAEGGLGAGGELAAGELAAGEAAAAGELVAGESASGLMAAFRSMGFRGLLAELSATLGGKLVIAGALLALIGGAVAAAVALGLLPLGGGAARGEGALDLSAPDGGPRMRFPKRSRSIDYLRQAYQGELKGDEAAQNGDGKDGAGKATDGKDGATADGKDAGKGSGWKDVLSNFADWRKDKLAHNLSMAKLSDSLGGGFSHNVFSASNAPKFGDGFDRGKLAQALPPKPAAAGKAQAMRDKRASTGKAAGVTSGVHAKRAIGQLRAAQTLSGQAASAGNEETARTMAGDAFNGGVSQGGVAPFSPIGMDNPTSGGAGTPPNPGGVGGTPPSVLLPEAPDATPIPQADYQPKVDMAKDLIDKAAAMKKKSIMLIAAGIALMAAGAALLSNPFTAAIGAAMIAAGALLLGMGIMLMIMAGKLAAQAKQIGQQLEQAFGQQAQNTIIDECATQAAASGTKCSQSVTDKQAPALPENNQMGDAGKAAQDENTGPDSGYKVDGGPIGGGH